MPLILIVFLSTKSAGLSSLVGPLKFSKEEINRFNTTDLPVIV